MSLEKRFSELLGMCSEQDRRDLLAILRKNTPIHKLEAEWNTTAEIVLEAIDRAPELTQRMFRGILAEAAFKVEVIDKLANWEDVTPAGNFSYDFVVKQGERTVTIQTKLQRSSEGEPMFARGKGLSDASQYVVEIQKTRSGKKKETGASTRPYQFGEFDILAVAMKPSTGNWASFCFTPCRWLIPRSDNPEWIQIYQPVSLQPNDDWTNDLATCIDWHLSGVQKTIRGGTSPKTSRVPKEHQTKQQKLDLGDTN